METRKTQQAVDLLGWALFLPEEELELSNTGGEIVKGDFRS
jgi:hypothetical protein